MHPHFLTDKSWVELAARDGGWSVVALPIPSSTIRRLGCEARSRALNDAEGSEVLNGAGGAGFNYGDMSQGELAATKVLGRDFRLHADFGELHVTLAPAEPIETNATPEPSGGE